MLQEAEIPLVAAAQPYGLTNFQTKLAAPLLTEAWVPLVGWSYHDARKILGMDPFAPDPKSGECAARTPRVVRFQDVIRLIFHVSERTGKSVDEVWQAHHAPSKPYDELVNWKHGGSREDAFNDLLSADITDADLLDQLMSAATMGPEAALRFDLSTVAALNPAVQSIIRYLLVPAAVWMRVTTTCGFIVERFASLSICGSEILFRGVNDAFLRMLNDDAILVECLKDVGYGEETCKKLTEYRTRVETAFVTGERLGPLDESVRVAFLQRFLQRRVLVVSDATPSCAKATYFDSRGTLPADNAALPCLILCEEWLGLPPCPDQVDDEDAVVFKGQLFPSSSIREAVAQLVTLPTVSPNTNLRGRCSDSTAFPDIRLLRDYIEGTGLPLLFTHFPPYFFAVDVPLRNAQHLNIPYENIAEDAFLTSSFFKPSVFTSPKRDFSPLNLSAGATLNARGTPSAIANANAAPSPNELSGVSASKQRTALLESSPFGKDIMAMEYLGSALPVGVNVLQSDADGHCLFHAVSRCLIGKQYLWHALRTALYAYMKQHRAAIEALFKSHEFLAGLLEEMETIVERVRFDSPVQPTDEQQSQQQHQEAPPGLKRAHTTTVLDAGLGTEHVFALCNLLRRPIVLYDGPTSPNPEGFLFLPLLIKPEDMVTNRALGIAWYSHEHGHFVSVVPASSDRAPVTLTAADIPTGQDGIPLVFAVAQADVPATLKSYLGSQNAADPSWALELGGDAPEAISPTLCSYLHSLFGARHGVGLGAVDAASQYFASSTLLTTSLHPAFTQTDTKVVTDLTLSAIKAQNIRRCHACQNYIVPELMPGSRTMKECPLCYASELSLSKGVVDAHTGVFPLEDFYYTPFPATAGATRTGFKKWLARKTPLGVNNFVTVSDHGSAYATARITAVYVDPLTQSPVCDVEFLSDRVNRYAVPISEILSGYAVDNVTQVKVAVCSLPFTMTITHDELPPLCTTPESLYDELLQLHGRSLKSYQLRTPTLDRNIKSDFKEYIDTSVDDFRRRALLAPKNLLAEMQRLRRAETGELGRQPTGDPLRDERDPASALQPVFTDEEGNEVVWESRDPISLEWIPYDRAASGKLEAAYRAKEKFCVVTISGYGDFTVVFQSMMQKNAIGGARVVRQITRYPFDCETCTYHNAGWRTQCEMCGTTRAGERFKVTLDAETVLRNRMNEKYTLPAFAEGGERWKLAKGAGWTTFGGTCYVRVDALKRYLPVEYPITKKNPLFNVIADMMKATGDELVEIGGLRFIKNSEGEGFVSSMNGRLLRHRDFLEFARLDKGLRGPDGDLFKLCTAQIAQHPEEINLEAYGGTIRFAISTHSSMGPLFAPVLLHVPPSYPLHADLNAAPRQTDGTVHHCGWQWRFDAVDGSFRTVRQLPSGRKPLYSTRSHRYDDYDYGDDDDGDEDESRLQASVYQMLGSLSSLGYFR